MELPLTLFFIAILVAMSVPMAVAVGLRRARTGIMLLHGDDDDLLRRIRAHGNFIEYVPLALIALAGAELSGGPDWLIIGCGMTLVVGRVVHYVTLRAAPTGLGRAVGAGLTSLTMLVLSGTILIRLAGGE